MFRGSDYNELGKIVGIDFRSSQTLNIEEGPLFSIGAGGDKYMSIIQMARVKQVPVMDEFKQNWDTLEEWSSKLQVQQLELLNDAYVKYKRAKGKLDFIDMIEKFISQGTSPKV